MTMFGSILGTSGQVIERPENLQLPSGVASVYDFKIKTIEGNEVDFNDLRGKKVLIVNVASECGYTGQYKGMQNLFGTLGDKVVVLAFPSNQFGKQEPGSNKDISDFCKEKFDVAFPVFEKTEVKGAGKNALYRWLTDKSMNGWNDKEPEWNFNKYLVNEKGELVAWFSSRVKPMDERITSRIR